MRIFLDIDSRRLFSAPGKPLTKLEFKRRDNDAIELIFLRENIAQELPAGTTAKVGVKVDAAYASEFLAVTTVTQSGSGTDTVYTGELNFNTTEMAAAFAAEPVTLPAMLEVEWLSGTVLSSSKTLTVILHNDVIRGDEGEPATLPLFYTSVTSDFQATQTQAVSGTDNTTWMTPLRTAEAIEALMPAPITSYSALTDIPTEFAPAAHSHTIADTTGLQEALDAKQPAGSYAAASHTHPLSDLTDSGATSGQVPTWSGTAWVPQTPSTVSGSGVTSYNDLTDIPTEFAPAAHTHTIADTTGLQSTLNFIDSNVSSLSTASSEANTSLSTALSTTDSNVESLSTAFSTTDSSIESLSTADASLSTALSTTDSNVGSLSTALSTTDSNVDSLSTADASLSTALSGISSQSEAADQSLSTALSTHATAVEQALNGKQDAGNYVLDDDSRLTDARTPVAHPHTIADINNLQLELDRIDQEKQGIGDYVIGWGVEKMSVVSSMPGTPEPNTLYIVV